MKVQLASDLHLEHFEDETELDFGLIICPSAPILVMAGDVATYDCPLLPLFLDWVSSKFDHVLWVLGNHEFYNTKRLSMCEIKNKLRSLCSLQRNVRILDNEFVMFEGVIFIGSTLWSHVPTEHQEKVQTMVSDYRYIFAENKNTQVTCHDTNKLHEESVEYIRNIIRQNKMFKKVVITHHAPSIDDTLHPRYNGSYLNFAFASNIAFDDGHGPDVWCYGHTHFNRTISKHPHGYRLVSNQFGYEGDHSGNIYKWDYVFEL